MITFRAVLISAVLIFSAAYAALIAKDEDFARTVGVGYIGLVLTLIVAVEFWKWKKR